MLDGALLQISQPIVFPSLWVILVPLLQSF